MNRWLRFNRARGIAAFDFTPARKAVIARAQERQRDESSQSSSGQVDATEGEAVQRASVGEPRAPHALGTTVLPAAGAETMTGGSQVDPHAAMTERAEK